MGYVVQLAGLHFYSLISSKSYLSQQWKQLHYDNPFLTEMGPENLFHLSAFGTVFFTIAGLM